MFAVDTGISEVATIEFLSPSNHQIQVLRIAKNADYLSSHLAFTSRLCDIAENASEDDGRAKKIV
jgi:hypothetical protein